MWPKLTHFQGWDYRQAPPFLVLTVLEINPQALCMLEQSSTNWTTSLTSGLSWMEMNWTSTSVVHVKIRPHVTAGRQPAHPSQKNQNEMISRKPTIPACCERPCLTAIALVSRNNLKCISATEKQLWPWLSGRRIVKKKLNQTEPLRHSRLPLLKFLQEIASVHTGKGTLYRVIQNYNKQCRFFSSLNLLNGAMKDAHNYTIRCQRRKELIFLSFLSILPGWVFCLLIGIYTASM